MLKPETTRQLMEAGFVSRPKTTGTWAPDAGDMLLGIARAGWNVDLMLAGRNCHVEVWREGDRFVSTGPEEEITDLVGRVLLYVLKGGGKNAQTRDGKAT